MGVTELHFELQAFKAKIKGVFRRSYCCYGNLLCHKINSNLFPDDCTVWWYHDVGGNKCRVVIMTHQTLSLEKYWKLFPATLRIQSWIFLKKRTKSKIMASSNILQNWNIYRSQSNPLQVCEHPFFIHVNLPLYSTCVINIAKMSTILNISFGQALQSHSLQHTLQPLCNVYGL